MMGVNIIGEYFKRLRFANDILQNHQNNYKKLKMRLTGKNVCSIMSKNKRNIVFNCNVPKKIVRIEIE